MTKENLLLQLKGNKITAKLLQSITDAIAKEENEEFTALRRDMSYVEKGILAHCDYYGTQNTVTFISKWLGCVRSTAENIINKFTDRA